MSNQLLEHCQTKFSRAGVIATSAGRNWAGVHAERRRHLAGELPPFRSVVTEVTYAIGGNPDAVVHRNGSGRIQATPVEPGTIWIYPEGVFGSTTRITGDLPDILHVCLPASLFRNLGDEVFPRLTERSLRYEAAVNDPLIGYMLSALARRWCMDRGRGKGPAATAQGRVVRHGQLQAEQRKHATREPFRLPQSQVEHEPQRQHQFDRQVRVAGLSAWRAATWRLPSRKGRFVHPERQVTAAA